MTTTVRRIIGIVRGGVLTVLGGLALGACNLPFPANVDYDAAPDAMPDAADPNTVHATSIVRHYTTAGMTAAPEDLSRYTLKAYVPDDTVATKFRIVDAIVIGPGTFELHDIPPGTGYYLEVSPVGSSNPRFYWTTAHQVDLGYPVVGRPDVTSLTTPSHLLISTSNLARWWDADALLAFSVGAGATDVGGIPDVAPASTSLADEDFDWSASFSTDPQSVTGGALSGDDVVLEHLRQSYSMTETAVSTIQVATWSDQTLAPGATMSLSGPMVDVPQTATTTLGADTFSLRIPYAADYVEDSIDLDLSAAPGADHGASIHPFIITFIPPTVAGYSRVITGSTAALSYPLVHGNPYGASFVPYHVVVYSRRQRNLRRSGAPIAVTVTQTASELDAGSTIDFTMQVAPPLNLRFDSGSAADHVVPYSATAPVTISWDKSAVASFYMVTIGRVGDGTTGQKTIRAVGRFVTDQTHVEVPADLFNDGDRYVFFVEAWRSPVQYTLGHLRDYQRPTYTASSASGVLLFSSTCGNGTIEQGEECDTMGQTATCNYDCTKPVCGDGIPNLAAGEQCDSGVIGSTTCNANCTAAKCGDSIMNTIAGEECDDGNTRADGNGCTAGCKIDHSTCGDGVKQTYGEQCDDGNQIDNDGCTNHCMLPQCGDGILQASNTEQCDDGNQINGDGCSSSCVIEP